MYTIIAIGKKAAAVPGEHELRQALTQTARGLWQCEFINLPTAKVIVVTTQGAFDTNNFVTQLGNEMHLSPPSSAREVWVIGFAQLN
ncbi:MAG TPA: hypothetical protein VFU74_08820 [Actinocrinis sp.]|nr:hypothetical protein [Actinocrinis sp.]